MTVRKREDTGNYEAILRGKLAVEEAMNLS
jgi:hypothetical protein